MTMFMMQLAILALLSLCLGYLPGRIARNLITAKQLKSHAFEYRGLRNEMDNIQGALDSCASRYQELKGIAEPEPENISADDLKRIYGIGTKLEGTLNGLGIYYIYQIAELTPEKEQWIDSHLRFKGRIERDKWIEQAKKLDKRTNETKFTRRYS